MKAVCFFIVVGLLACHGNVQENLTGRDLDTSSFETKTAASPDPEKVNKKEAPSPKKTFSNSRFKEVTVEKIGGNSYVVQGAGQVFEANFGWVVEDGHYELAKGFQMTDGGAPEWGNFRFTIEVQKERPGSTLTLILYETSAKDGSRQHELPIALE